MLEGVMNNEMTLLYEQLILTNNDEQILKSMPSRSKNDLLEKALIVHSRLGAPRG